jgi:hypothetical protein
MGSPDVYFGPFGGSVKLQRNINVSSVVKLDAANHIPLHAPHQIYIEHKCNGKVGKHVFLIQRA